MLKNRIYLTILYCNAAVWLVNGLICKVLNLVPRHEGIVARVVGDYYARPLTFVIGLSEILMCVWVLLPKNRKFNVFVQVVIVLSMNVIEFIIAPDLLLWGRFNILFALTYSAVIYYNEFILLKNSYHKPLL